MTPLSNTKFSLRKLNRHTRNAVYREALRLFTTTSASPYLCDNLKFALYNLTGRNEYYTVMTYLFPEFARHKPERLHHWGAWWKVRSKKKRIDVLKQCIKETE